MNCTMMHGSTNIKLILDLRLQHEGNTRNVIYAVLYVNALKSSVSSGSSLYLLLVIP
jgi:hypothetical protein